MRGWARPIIYQRAQKKTRCLRSGFPVQLPVVLPVMAWHY